MAAGRYWLLAFPHARRSIRRCALSAARIPHPEPRAAAVTTIEDEQGNLEGAAAFAAFVPGASRRAVVEALVSFQAAFDYADTLAEQAPGDPATNAHALHQALLDALAPRAPRQNYYARWPGVSDGGYLDGLVVRCRRALASLPSHRVVERPLRCAVHRMIAYQTLIHGDGALAPNRLAAWARGEALGSGLRWWEAAAAGASSLVAFALIAAAAEPRLSAREAAAIEHAYHPWIGALHVLLDSLVDRPQDDLTGHHSLVAHYATPTETAERMDMLATTAVRRVAALPHAHRHKLLLASMAGYYLAQPGASLPHAAETTALLTVTFGELARPVLAVHRARGRLRPKADRN